MSALRTSVRAAWIVVGVLCLPACSDDDADAALPQESFENWCGEQLCDWDTDVGRIEPVPTWHPDDLGVSLLDTPTRISMLHRASTTRCFFFDMIAHVDLAARLVAELDFNDDGVVDFAQQVPDVPWKSWPFTVPAPIEYDGVRFILLKEGEGLAVIGQLRVLDQGHCPGEPLKLKPGSGCQMDAVCESGVCAAGNCQPCRDGTCSGDDVTSLAAPGGAE